MVDQIRRAAISIMSNIANELERNGNRGFLQFLAIAKDSPGEIRSQMYIALDRGHTAQGQFIEDFDQLIEASRTISGSMKYLQNAPERGGNFK